MELCHYDQVLKKYREQIGTLVSQQNVNKRYRKLKGQSTKDNLEIQATLDTKHRRRQTNKIHFKRDGNNNFFIFM